MWKSRVAGCFGERDLIFAGHSEDENRLFALLTLLRIEGVGWAKVRKEIRSFLASKKCSSEHISREMKKVRSYLRPWLAD
jgi:hypothetical protein